MSQIIDRLSVMKKMWAVSDMQYADFIAMQQCEHWIDSGIKPAEALASLGIGWPRRYVAWAHVNSCLMELWLDMRGLQR